MKRKLFVLFISLKGAYIYYYFLGKGILYLFTHIHEICTHSNITFIFQQDQPIKNKQQTFYRNRLFLYTSE